MLTALERRQLSSRLHQWGGPTVLRSKLVVRAVACTALALGALIPAAAAHASLSQRLVGEYESLRACQAAGASAQSEGVISAAWTCRPESHDGIQVWGIWWQGN
jgi:hypothetical protein